MHAPSLGEVGPLPVKIYRSQETISTGGQTQVIRQNIIEGARIGVRLMPNVSLEEFAHAMLDESKAQATEPFPGSREIAVNLATQDIAGFDELFFSLLFGAPGFIDDVYASTIYFTPIEPPLKRLSPFFLYENHGQGWRRTWMGWVNDYHGYDPFFPTNWMFSLRHGWIWGTYPDVLLGWDYFSFFSFSIGWFLTNQETYPMAWAYDQNKWINLNEF